VPEFGIIAGQTDKTIYMRLRDSTTGLAKTGLAWDSAGAVCSYTLPGALRAAIALVTQTVNGAHDPGGFVEVDATNAKGLYRLDLPDAVIASGAFVIVSIEFDGVIEESQVVPLTAARAAVRDDEPVVQGRLSLRLGEVRDDIGRAKLFWDFTDVGGATDFSVGSTGTLTIASKFDASDQVTISVDLDSVSDLGGNTYRAIFAISEAEADQLLLGDRMLHRVEVRHAGSGAVVVPNGAEWGQVIVY